MRVLVAGWFSYAEGHSTAGDLFAKDLVCEWLAAANVAHDVALATPHVGGVDWRVVTPGLYTHAIFVCGPFEQKALETAFLERFQHCFLIGLNLSMLVSLDRWSPFDLLLERDSSACARADLVFMSQAPRVPIVGRCLVEPYEGAIDAVANAKIASLLETRELAVVEIDTRLDVNTTGLRSPREVESLIARMDVLVTTRLHGLVLALKNGVPVIAIDPERGGAKIMRQAAAIRWPLAFTADAASAEELSDAFDYCMTEEARALARSCASAAATLVADTRHALMSTLTGHLSGAARTSDRRG